MRNPKLQPPANRHKIGYARVSTSEQNLEMQIEALKRYGVDELHVEKVSTRKARREKLEHAISEIREGDVFVVWRLDRIGRSVEDLLNIVRRIREAGASLVSLMETIDMTTPAGTMMFHMFIAFAQFERDIISERTAAGMKAFKERGGKAGRAPSLDEKAIAKALKLLNAGTMSKAAVGRAVGVSPTTINNYFIYQPRKRVWIRKPKA